MLSRWIRQSCVAGLLAHIALFAYAGPEGNEVGNGGNAVVCPGQVELLDIYEARILRKLQLDSRPNSQIGEDPFAMAAERVKRLAAVDARTAGILTTGIIKLKTVMSFEPRIKIKAIDDSKHPFEPSDPKCRVEQLAVFRKRVLPGEKSVLVNETLWKKMPAAHRAGLVLHEAIYRYLSDLGETDSSKARYLTTFLLSSELTGTGKKEYWALIKKLRLPIYQ